MEVNRELRDIVTRELLSSSMKVALPKPIKIALVGKMRSGKDTVAEYLVDNYGFKQVAFGWGIKSIIREFFPESMANGNKPRGHYQFIGQALRELNPDVWINKLFREVDFIHQIDKEEREPISNIVVSDCRQLNEANRLRAEGYTIVKIVAPKENRIERMKEVGDFFTEEQLEHDTEKQVDLITPDILLENFRSKEYLYKAVDDLMVHLGGEAIG